MLSSVSMSSKLKYLFTWFRNTVREEIWAISLPRGKVKFQKAKPSIWWVKSQRDTSTWSERKFCTEILNHATFLGAKWMKDGKLVILVFLAGRLKSLTISMSELQSTCHHNLYRKANTLISQISFLWESSCTRLFMGKFHGSVKVKVFWLRKCRRTR